MKAIRVSVAVVAAMAAMYAQTSPARPEFEVASVKPAAQQRPEQAAIGVHIDGAQLRCSYLTLKDYIRIAYRLKINQIIGPDWIATENFDIAAKLPEGAPASQVPEMLQKLLEDRFQLKSHRESRDFSVYGLVAAKGGLKLDPLPPDPDEAPGAHVVDVSATGGAGGVSINFGRGSSFSLGNNKFQIRKLTLSQFADALSRFADRMVVDMTATSGKYDFTVEMTPEDYRAMLIRSAISAGVSLPPEAMRLLDGASGESLFMSLQAVGLKLETRKAPVDVLVVDHAAKAPAAN